MVKSDIEWIEIHSLRPLEINPRFIKDENFRKLQQSILRDPKFMELRPVLANKTPEGLFIYAGTQRWKACKDLGWDTVPCIVESNLADHVVKARMLKDNIHAGVYDFAKLAEFDDSILEILDITEQKANKLNFVKLQKNPDSEGQNDTNPNDFKAKKAEHQFNLIFSDVDDLEEFDEVSRNLPLEGQKLEAFIIEKAHEVI